MNILGAFLFALFLAAHVSAVIVIKDPNFEELFH
jgi:hypothetical protein